jgi:hypothetical protein
MEFLILVAVVLLVIVVVFLAGAGLLIFFMTKLYQNRAAIGSNKLRPILEDWADDHDLELLEIDDAVPRDHPFADRFGSGFGKKPALVRSFEVRDRKGRIRRGWVYIRMRMAHGGFGGFVLDSLEVEWDD